MKSDKNVVEPPTINLEESVHEDIDKYEFQFMTARNKTPRDLGIVNAIENNTFQKQDYIDVEREVDKNYLNMNHKYSSSLDILASYLKGQKIIYMESKNYCERQLNFLMLPAILLSAAATVLAGMGGIVENSFILACVNALIGFLLALVNYLKLDAAQEAHKISSRQYDKLQSGVEFTSGAILLFQSDIENAVDYQAQEEKLREKLRDVEHKIAEIKDTNQFLTPAAVRRDYPVMFNINVFSLIKKIEDRRKKTITSLKNVKNEISFIQFIQQRQDYDLDPEYKTKLVSLFAMKKGLIEEILILQSAYSMIDSMFLQEMKNAEVIKRRWCRWCKMCCEPKIVDPEKINPFIAKLIDPFKRNEDFETIKEGCCVSLCCMTKKTHIISQKDSGDAALWFKSDENHCTDGKCGVSLVNKVSNNGVDKGIGTDIEMKVIKVDKQINTDIVENDIERDDNVKLFVEEEKTLQEINVELQTD